MDSLRHRARTEFVRLYIENGGITRRWFAEYSLQILGEEVPLETIRWWYKVDSWAARLGGASFDSVDLRRTKRLLDGIFGEIEQFKSGDLPLTDKEFSHVALTLHVLITGLPMSLVSLIEDELIDATDLLYDYVDSHFSTMLKSHRVSIRRSYTALRGRSWPERP